MKSLVARVILLAAPSLLAAKPVQFAKYEDLRKQHEKAQEQASDLRDSDFEIRKEIIRRQDSIDNMLYPKKDAEAAPHFAPVENPKPIEKPESSQPADPSASFFSWHYLKRLGNVYGCMKVFITSMHKTREARDERLLSCARGDGSYHCESPANDVLQQRSDGFVHDFKACLDDPSASSEFSNGFLTSTSLSRK